MAIDIFRLDWILIDSVIIFLLFLVLISVKLFKERLRWRASLSNESLELINFKQSDLHLKNQYFNVKNMSFIRPIFLNKETESSPLIFIFKPSKKKKLLYILAEGLVSYGFKVVIVNIEEYLNYDKIILDNKLQKENESIFSMIINFLEENKFISNSNYIFINYLIPYFSFKSLLFDPKNYCIFLLNPKLNKINLKHFSEVSKLIKFKSIINIIFSKNLSFLVLNKNLNRFLKRINNENDKVFRVIAIEKARKSFKYYETILLGILIYLINKNFLNN